MGYIATEEAGETEGGMEGSALCPFHCPDSVCVKWRVTLQEIACDNHASVGSASRQLPRTCSCLLWPSRGGGGSLAPRSCATQGQAFYYLGLSSPALEWENSSQALLQEQLNEWVEETLESKLLLEKGLEFLVRRKT